MPNIRAVFLPIVLAGVLACSPEHARTSAGSTGASAAAGVPLPAFAPTNGWPATLGRVMVVSSDSAAGGLLVLPQFTDSTLDPALLSSDAYRGARVALFGSTGIVGDGILVPAPNPTPTTSRDSSRAECTGWPPVRVANRTSSARWVVAFSSDSLQVVPFALVGGADSTLLASAILKLARTFPHDTSAALRGVPFELRDINRAVLAPGDTSYLVTLERHLNQEAMPLAEQLFTVLERDSAGHLVARFVDRASGLEDEVETTDPLLLFRLPADSVPLLLLRHDFGDGVTYTLLERPARGGEWDGRWNSAYTGC